MYLQYAVAASLLLSLSAFMVWCVKEGRKERKHRAELPVAEQDALEKEDALWAQRYGF